MFWFILGIVVAIGLFIALGFSAIDTGRTNWDGLTVYEYKWGLKIRQFIAILGLLLCLFGCLVRIPANTVGIVYSPFYGTQEQTLTEGFHSKNIFDKVYKINTEVQTTTVENLTTQTKDAQYLTSVLDIKYRVSNANAYLVFKNFKTLDNVANNLIVPTTQRVLELVTTKYNVIDILGEDRSAIYTELEAALSEEFAQYGIEFYSISITDMDAGETLENAIAAEAVAKKEVETAEQNLLKAETEAKQQVVEAQAEQDAAKIEAETKIIEAEGEQKANELLNESLTEEVLQKEWIAKWDGKMPTYYGGSDGMGIMIDTTSVAEKAE